MAKKKASPVGGKKGCLCDNGTYHVDCCTGELKAQGIGATTDLGVSNITHNLNPITTVTSN